MSNKKTSGGFPFIVSALAIAICMGIGAFIYMTILGNVNNFDAEGHPKPGNFLGIMYKGGFIVPILLGVFLTVLTFAIERFITIQKASGKGATDKFVSKIKSLIANHDLDAA
ncbi:MAG TPA: MotA/TolQ/ExbB proton channel family protein, partial [Bacteroidia bacterium]|nr:MotA/TolQ/ExbB proton channel family protein [Bacteroidia bacterium]